MVLDREVIGPDSIGKGTLRTPITFFEKLLDGGPGLIEYIEPPPQEKAILIEHFEHQLSIKL